MWPNEYQIRPVLHDLIESFFRSVRTGRKLTLEIGVSKSAVQLIEDRIRSIMDANSKSGVKLASADFVLSNIRIRHSESLIYVEFIEHFKEYYGSVPDYLSAYVTEGSRTYALSFQAAGENSVSLNSIFVEDLSDSHPTPRSDSVGNPLDIAALTASTTWTWSGSDAARYSDTHALRYNPEYRSYQNDCTNFISQCLEAGGKTETGGIFDRENDDVWFYGALESTTSYTWAGAQNLKRHLEQHTNSSLEADHRSLGPGDLVFIDPNGGSGVWHAMIVAAQNGNDALMNYHTRDTKRKSLNQIKQTQPSHKKFWYVKVGNTYS